MKTLDRIMANIDRIKTAIDQIMAGIDQIKTALSVFCRNYVFHVGFALCRSPDSCDRSNLGMSLCLWCDLYGMFSSEWTFVCC